MHAIKQIVEATIYADDLDKAEQFYRDVLLLPAKLLCATLQFGYFNRKVFPDQEPFLQRLEGFLQSWPTDVQLAVEVRNKEWMNEALAQLLRQHRAVWVLPDQAWMPPPLEIVEKMDPVTGPFGYVRLLGDREAVDKLTPKLDHIVIDRSGQIESVAQAIVRLAKRVPMLVFVNNHYAGYAPQTAQELRAAIDRQNVEGGPI